jgi:tetratricopeptide (TPR) repeat protein
VAPCQEGFKEAYARAEELRASGPAKPAREAYRQALRAFLRLPAPVRGDPGWLRPGAFCAFQSGEHALAVDLFEESMRAGNQDAFHAEHLLRAQLGAGLHGEMLHSARDLEPRFPAAVRRVLVDDDGLGQAQAWLIADRWLRSGGTEDGLWVFRYLARASGDHPHALANLALALRHLGREQECEATYRRALEGAPDDASIWNDFGLFLKGAGRLREAVEVLVRSRGLEARLPTGPATTNLALLGLRTGNHALASPAIALAAVLERRPGAAMARRAYLDVLTVTAPPFPSSAPDRERPPK